MTKKTKKLNIILIIIAACFWGSMGIFVRRLTAFGFDSIQIVSIRVTLAALIFSVFLLIRDRSGFRIALRDIPLFLGLGLGSILFFTVCYFAAITIMPLSTAAILLYTSPIWIMLMSALFFHEKMNGKKVIALLLAFGGCVLVSGISGEGITLTGLLLGLGSGIGYGCIAEVFAILCNDLYFSDRGRRLLGDLQARRHAFKICESGTSYGTHSALRSDGLGNGGDPVFVIYTRTAHRGSQ